MNSESAVTIITDVSPLLPPPHAWILLFPLIHSFALFSPPTLRALKKKKKIGKRKRERKKEKRSPEPLFQRLRSSDFFFPLPLDSPIEWTIYADAFTAVHGWRQGALFSCMQAAYRRFDVPSPGIGTENCNVGADNVSPNDRYRPYRNTG